MLETSTNVKANDKPWLIKPGQVLNPKGRTKGSKNKIAESLLDALLTDFEANGAQAIATCRETNVAAYLNICAKMVPVEFNVNHKSAFDEMSVNELTALTDAINGRINGITIEGTASLIQKEAGALQTISEAEVIP